jgi:REP element-mobilizing transposase RayT
MPGQLRIEYPGAIYHLMSRGNRCQDIFLDDVDRQDFLKTVAEASQKTGWQVHAYCLMANHYHLVLQTPNGNLVAGMGWLQSTYTIRLNHRHQLTGHVLSGRYKAQLWWRAAATVTCAAQARSGQGPNRSTSAQGDDAFGQGDCRAPSLWHGQECQLPIADDQEAGRSHQPGAEEP